MSIHSTDHVKAMNIDEVSIPSRFAEEMKNVDTTTLAKQRAAIKAQKAGIIRTLAPVEDPLPTPTSHPSLVMKGKKVGCIVLAGGQATRLGSSSPKGVIPFSTVAGKPLLQIIAEKVSAYEKCYGVPAHLAIMTSDVTDEATKALFDSNHSFGLQHVDFFMQQSLPLLDMEGKLIMESDGSLLKGPDGNGGVFERFAKSGILQRWEEDGVEALSIIIVDNPLIDPFCPSMFAPIFAGTDLTAAAIERVSENEKVGVFAIENNRIEVVEYSEIDPALSSQKDQSGRLVFRWANISSFACSMPYIKAAAEMNLPLHVAKKVVKGHDVWKAEYFVFDAMAAAKTIDLIPLARNDFFAPVKDKSSFEKSRQDMMEHDRRRFVELTGVTADIEEPFELGAQAYYPTDSFLKWLRSCGVRRGLLEEPS